MHDMQAGSWGSVDRGPGIERATCGKIADKGIPFRTERGAIIIVKLTSITMYIGKTPRKTVVIRVTDGQTVY